MPAHTQGAVQDPNSDGAKLEVLKDEISTLRGEVRGLSAEFTEAEQLLASKEAEAKDEQVQTTNLLLFLAVFLRLSAAHRVLNASGASRCTLGCSALIVVHIVGPQYVRQA